MSKTAVRYVLACALVPGAAATQHETSPGDDTVEARLERRARAPESYVHRPAGTVDEGFSGNWKTSYAEIVFEAVENANIRGTYKSDAESDGHANNGRILATVDGRALSGHWVEDVTEQRCASEKDGSFYWAGSSYAPTRTSRSSKATMATATPRSPKRGRALESKARPAPVL